MLFNGGGFILDGGYYPVEDAELVTKQARSQYVRSNVCTEYHLIHGAQMSVDGVGVVDKRIEARETKGLRIVDAGVMPTHISGHPQATAYAIAEKGVHPGPNLMIDNPQ
jgi:choline dehydrogenase-like flavoprotein